MGLVSSALYRYFATRDELLTALILDAYNDLGAAVERAEAKVARSDFYGRWMASAKAVRRWARAHPHEYALVYGTPSPEYHAPPETIDAAARVARVLGRIIAEHDALEGPGVSDRARPRDVERFLEVANLAEVLPGVDPAKYAPALMAWTEIYGFVSFELFGHYVGSVKNANVMFDRVVDELAHALGLEGP